jgi:hypothetical protein
MQLALTYAIIALAVGYVLWTFLRPWIRPAKGGCGNGCGKCVVPEAPSPPGRTSLPQI